MTLIEWLLVGILISSALNGLQNLSQRRTVNKLNSEVAKRQAEYMDWLKEARIKELESMVELAKGSDALAQILTDIKATNPEFLKG